MKRISVINETKTGRNKRFRDNITKEKFSRAEFIRRIKSGEYSRYYVREMNVF